MYFNIPFHFIISVCCRAAGASTAMAYWLSDSTPLQFMNFFGCLCFAAPLYYMAGLRSGIGRWEYTFSDIFYGIY